MDAVMKGLYVLWVILASMAVAFIAAITFPLLLLYIGVRIIGGMASKIR